MDRILLKPKRFYLAAAIFLIIATLTGSAGDNRSTTASSGNVVFSEVLYDSKVTRDTTGEWIEFYNPRSTAVDIGGWTLEDNSGKFTIPRGNTINAFSYFVITDDASYFYSQYGCYPDIVRETVKLGNDGDFLKLRNSSGTIIDQVAWESGGRKIFGWGSSSQPYANEGKTIRRSNPNTDTDTHSDWISNSSPQPDCGSGSGGKTSFLSPKPEKSTNIKSSSSTTKKTSATKKNRKYTPVAVQCRGYTKKGRHCKRKTTHSSGYCWQHR